MCPVLYSVKGRQRQGWRVAVHGKVLLRVWKGEVSLGTGFEFWKGAKFVWYELLMYDLWLQTTVNTLMHKTIDCTPRFISASIACVVWMVISSHNCKYNKGQCIGYTVRGENVYGSEREWGVARTCYRPTPWSMRLALYFSLYWGTGRTVPHIPFRMASWSLGQSFIHISTKYKIQQIICLKYIIFLFHLPAESIINLTYYQEKSHL